MRVDGFENRPSALIRSDPQLEQALRELARAVEGQAPCVRRLLGFAMQSTSREDLTWLLHVAHRLLEAEYLLAESRILDRARTRIAYLR